MFIVTNLKPEGELLDEVEPGIKVRILLIVRDGVTVPAVRNLIMLREAGAPHYLEITKISSSAGGTIETYTEMLHIR